MVRVLHGSGALLHLAHNKCLLVQAPGNSPQTPIHVCVPAQEIPVWVVTFTTAGMEMEGNSYMVY